MQIELTPEEYATVIAALEIADDEYGYNTKRFAQTLESIKKNVTPKSLSEGPSPSTKSSATIN